MPNVREYCEVVSLVCCGCMVLVKGCKLSCCQYIWIFFYLYLG